MIDLTALGTITSGFGQRNTGIAGASTNHKGVDISLNDTAIPAAMSGTVVLNTYDSGGGNMLSIKQDDGTTATYMHMASPSPLGVGARVTEGNIVGTMGSTGVSSGPHLHYQVKNSDGNFIDPVEYLKNGVKDFSAGGLGSVLTDNATSTTGGDILASIVKFTAFLTLGALGVFLFLKAFKTEDKNGQKI